ncbi:MULTISPECIES: DNA primase [Candidatus Ichthyocystis]|uniref:DNA primase n=1 Tax=Candidatus Ichthyocystis hellenicum TaxID=1561003 RepID=A0A0S4M2P6_9BURK|nr:MULTISPECIES: DNA primase [Ichthyocystis]CUT17018.1 DNA primase [Candidatus Ichthyocystis hellenicum]
MISEAFIQELLRRVDIVEVLRACLDIKRVGSNYVSCCPFHSDKTPSFTISPTKQFYHCFGCGAHGTAIGFLMKHYNLSFPEAVSRLASSVGMLVPTSTSASSSQKGDPESVLSPLLNKAVIFYKQHLSNSKSVIAYLSDRGLSSDTCQRFDLGFAPNSYQNLRAIFGKQYSSPDLKEAGLVSEGRNGSLYDRFRGRVMFPIRSVRGNFIGFGGRVLSENKQPKYLNSPDTTLFHKGHELYGLYHNMSFIRHERAAIVVEGYIDLLSLVQNGINNVVASLGTSCTTAQMKLLFRYADTVYYCFDGDAAGRKAALRVAESILPILVDGKQVYFLLLPEGEDPDSYVAKQGCDDFRNILFQSKPLSSFLIDDWRVRFQLDTVEGRAIMIHGLRETLLSINAPIFKISLMRELSVLTNIPEEQLLSITDAGRFSSSDTSSVVDYRGDSSNSKSYSANIRDNNRYRVPSLAQRIARLLLSKPREISNFAFPIQFLDIQDEDFCSLKDLILVLSELSPGSNLDDIHSLLVSHPRARWFSKVLSLDRIELSRDEWMAAFRESCLALEKYYLESKCDIFLEKISKKTIDSCEKDQFFLIMNRLQDLKSR